MRIKPKIRDKFLAGLKKLVPGQGKGLGEVISSLARKMLVPRRLDRTKRNGVPLLPPPRNAVTVTPELVSNMADEFESLAD
jgi:hypothetical protein